MILPISQDGKYIFPSPRCKTCETSLSLLSHSMSNKWANLARTTFKIPHKCNFFLPPMQPSWAQPQTSLVCIIIPTGPSVPASAPCSLISTKYPEWSYQNMSHFTSLLQSTGCSPIPPNWIRSSYSCLQALSCLAFLPLWPHFLFLPSHSLHSRHRGLPAIPQHTRHAPTWHLRVPSAQTVLLPCKYMAPLLTSSVYSKTTFPSRPTQISPYKLATLAPCWRSWVPLVCSMLSFTFLI